MLRRRILLKDNSTIDISDKAIITCSSKTYNSQTQIATDITVTVNESVLIEDVDYVITQNDGGINAGQYSIIISGINKYCGTKQGQFTIVKVTPTVTIPTPRTSITYNGSEQALINAGSTDFGTLKYSLDDSTYSTTIPSGINATSYTVYYKVEGDSNINDVAAQSISVTIAKASTTYTAPTAKSLTYNGSSQALLNAGAVTGGTIYYSSDNTNWSATIPTGSNAGSYTSYWKITGDSNHTDKASASISTTISKATGSVSFGTSSVTAYTIQSTYQQTASKNGTGSLTYSSNNTSVATVNSSGLVTLKSTGTVRITASMASSTNYTSASDYYTITVQTLASPTTFNVTLSSWELYNSDSTYRYYRSTNHTHSSSGTTTLTAISSGSITLDVRSYAESTYDYVVVKKGSTILASTSGKQSSSVYTTVYSNVSAGDVISVIYRKDTSVDKDDDTGYLKIAASYLPIPSYTAPTAKSLTYNGSAQALLNSGSATGGTIQYSSDNSNWSTTIPSGTNAASYTSYWRIVGDNVHRDKASTSISTTINKAAMSYTAPKVTTYTYGNTARALVSGSSAAGGSIQYCATQSGTYSTTVPTQTNAGTYTTWWKAVPDSNHSGGTNAASLTTTINCYSATAPTAKNPNWTGSAQNLINAGSTSYGTMVYSTNNSSWSTTIPTSTNAGSYTVYWKVSGNTNVCQTASTSISCSIKQVAMSYTAPKAATRTYNGSAQQIVSGGSATGGNIYYATSNAGASSSTTVPTQTNAGSYTVYWKAVPDGNHSGGTSSWDSISCSIAKKAVVCTAPTAKSLTWNGSAQTLANAGGCEGGTIQYCSTSGGTYSGTIPTGTNAGSYTVWYKCTASNNNYSGTCSGSTSCSIGKKTGCTVSFTTTSITKSFSDGSFTNTATNTGDATITYGSNNTGICEAYSSGSVGINSTGSCKIAAAVSNTNNCTYSITGVTYNVSIQKGALTITANNQTINYGGSIATGVSQVTTSGLSPKDGLTAITLTQSGTGVPGSNIIPSAAATRLGSSNYSIVYNAGYVTIKPVAMSYTAPKAATRTYNGSAQQVVSGGSATGGNIYYATSSAGASSSTTIPTQTNAGSYTTYWKAVPDSNHSGGTSSWASISCSIEKAGGWYEVYLLYPVYNGSPQALIRISESTGQMHYSLDNSNWSTSIPSGTSAGNYTVYMYMDASTNYTGADVDSIPASVKKAACCSTAPTAKSLTYNGSAQALVNAGSSSCGTMQYCATSGGTYTTTIPTQTNAGTYTTYWKVNNDSNHSGTCSGSVSTTIAKCTPTLDGTPTCVPNWTFDDTAHVLLTYTSTVSDCSGKAIDGTFSSDSAYNAGTHSNTRWYFFPTDTTNYKTATGTANCSVTVYCKPCTAPTAKSLIYTGSAQALVNAGSTSYGKMVYSTTSGGTYSTSIPTGTNAGSYEVWWKVTGNTNVCCTAATKIDVTIEPILCTLTLTGGSTVRIAGTGTLDKSSISGYSSSIATATISSNCTAIGISAFSGATKMTSVTIPGSVTSIGNGAFSGCTSLTSATIPNSVTSIGRAAFNSCKLASVTIPSGVTTINNYAFFNCTSLKSVVIGANVNTVNSMAFNGCSSLNNITFLKETPPQSTSSDAFRNISSTGTLYVPSNATTLYTNWVINYITRYNTWTVVGT